MVSDTPSPPPAPAPLQTPLPDSAAPFIVTAELPADLLAWSDALRRAHFPPERNWLKAHVTLFHAFAPSLREELLGLLGQYAGEYAPPRARIEGTTARAQSSAPVVLTAKALFHASIETVSQRS